MTEVEEDARITIFSSSSYRTQKQPVLLPELSKGPYTKLNAYGTFFNDGRCHENIGHLVVAVLSLIHI